ncbi:hypothetical protein EDB86DRAFT_3249055 [Lactarius hatsudake]|nr:hypothetical protein EDB86DRAFT_3249055 [Lactarius hatsudake]
MAQICNQFSSSGFLFDVEDLNINAIQPSTEQDVAESEHWPELIHSFGGAERLSLHGDLVINILRTLQAADRENSDPLPALKYLCTQHPASDLQAAVYSFVTPRQLSGRPIYVEHYFVFPPISSFDIPPTRMLHTGYPPASPSASSRLPNMNDILSWFGSSTASDPLRRDLDPPSDARLSPSTYDDLNYSAHAHGNHSPYTEPAGLVAPSSDQSPQSTRNSSPSLDHGRRGPVVPQVPTSRHRRIAQRFMWAPSRYHPPFYFAQYGRRQHLAPYVPRKPSPNSREQHSCSSTQSPNVPTHLHPGTVPSPHAGNPALAGTLGTPAGGASGTARVPAQMAASINTAPGDAQEAQIGGAVVTMGSERRPTSPVRKRRVSEMLGTATSTGSDEQAISPEPSESEARKKYKKETNVRHCRAQNEDVMTQLRHALPEHMRPPKRQAKEYVALSAIKYIRELTAENERLRAENVRQAQEFTDRPSHDAERSSSGEVAITDETNNNDNVNGN